MSGLQGKRLGDYELIEPIGEGGMAEVYRAKQCTAFDREVALKVIRPEFTGDEPFRRRFLREAHVIARLSHPHILPLIEFGHEQGTLYLVMPLVREGTLRDLLKEHQAPLSLEEALPLFVPLCDAVQYAHQEDVIHRDIKPQNILLQRHTHVLLADFGIAHDRFDTKMTTTGIGIGSVEYMAPEQAEGRADTRSDIYSLGVVLYQLLTGTVPYSGPAPLQVLFKKANDPLPDPRKQNPNLPAEIVDILQIALAREPHQRFASAEALGHAFEQIMSHAVPSPLQSQMPWRLSPDAGARGEAESAGTQFPQAPAAGGAPALQDVAAASTLHIHSDQSSWEAHNDQGLATAATTPVPADSTPTLRYTSQWSVNSQEPLTTEGWAATNKLHNEDWYNAPVWGNQRDIPPPDANRRNQRPRLLAILLVSTLAAVLLLTMCVSSVASGHLGLAWLHPGSASTGSQLLTPTPGSTIQPTQFPGPVSTLPAWPPVGTTQPTSTAMSQPTGTVTAQPTTTTTTQPTATTTSQPGATATSVPTDIPAPQPTATPAPVPTDTPAPQPTAPTQGPNPLPGNAPYPNGNG